MKAGKGHPVNFHLLNYLVGSSKAAKRKKQKLVGDHLNF